MLNVDTALVGGLAGVTALGFYVLAFNISSWPTSVIGNAVRAVAFPAFAQRSLESGEPDAEGAVRATGLVWAAAVPVAAALAVLSAPVVEPLYGPRWLAAAPVLTALAVFGALRVVFDLWVAYFTASGAAGTLVSTQVAWLLALTPAMWVGIEQGGIEGAGWAHAAVAVLVMLPVYAWRMRRCGVPAAPLLRRLVPPLLAVLPAALVGGWIAALDASGAWATMGQLVLGGLALLATYTLLLWPWVRREVHGLRPAARTDVEEVLVG